MIIDIKIAGTQLMDTTNNATMKIKDEKRNIKKGDS